jgi:hypothetical protein
MLCIPIGETERHKRVVLAWNCAFVLEIEVLGPLGNYRKAIQTITVEDIEIEWDMNQVSFHSLFYFVLSTLDTFGRILS